MITLTGGERLQATLERLRKRISNPATLRVGFLENATYPNGTSVPYVAYIQEFGAGKIPPRSYFRTMIAAKQESWAVNLAGVLKRNDWDAAKSLDFLGAHVIKPQLQNSIAALMSPPLSPITVMLRKMRQEKPGLTVTGATVGEAARRVHAGMSSAGVSTKPLIEPGEIGGGLLLRSIGHEVTSE